ncbi:putative trans-sulfuration enzyme [Protomyces lactucae-debilis]|uniref:Putative trans-sulfuration enzyme n=1 Tax=Protomyces lactucae-debilis TaxID=2754530 RepID=A0A1Y2F989_PROLT|nr:putative trans-sulfuration enzyme [Protomyces lactucae-debilis]ORY80459.1 putative trans-sulfuration enzyme [Protomyces lactucae-debilis]
MNATSLIHADDHIESACDVAPPIHMSTTYAYTSDNKVQSAIYSRLSVPTIERCEAVLHTLLQGSVTVTYASGLSAIMALLCHLHPAQIFLERAEHGGYHGTLGVAGIISRLNGMKVHHLDTLDTVTPGKGDVIWLETPLNPTGEVTDIAHYVEIAKKHGAVVCVDSTFAPPPLQNPFEQGADWVMHSATKYFGGHSDLLAGVIAARPGLGDAESLKEHLIDDRENLGTAMSGQTAWLLLRSLRTFKMRIERQVANGAIVAARMAELVKEGKLQKVVHGSLQEAEGAAFVKKQMPGGYSPTFAIYLKNEKQASTFPNKLKLFHHATSLGGVESLAEWRTMSDSQCDRTLVRLSIGVEDAGDLVADIEQALVQVSSL